MRSIQPQAPGIEPVDDRTTNARIRDAAVECIAKHGTVATTARKVAEAAGVSPGLVIHHFGSMDGLRAACDEYVATVIRHHKQEAMSAGPNLDVLAALRNSDMGPLMGYLASVLADSSEAVAGLVDDLVDDAEAYIQQGVESGMLRPSDNARGRAVVLTIWSLGALAMYEHLERLLGVDLTDPHILNDPAIAAYAGPIYEIYGNGLFAEEFAAQTREALAGMAGTQDHTEPHETAIEGTS